MGVPVPKQRAQVAPADPTWQNPHANQVVAQAADHLEAAITRLTATHDLDFIEGLLWIVELVCRRQGLEPLGVLPPSIIYEAVDAIAEADSFE